MVYDYNKLNETLLLAWIRLSTAINNSRFVSKMSYNESIVCSILYKHQIEHPDTLLTATDLCQSTKMLKSQMNRILNQLEKKDLIIRTRSTTDRRQVNVTFNFDHAETFEQQHQHILNIIDHVIMALGEEKTNKSIQLFNEISDIADELFYNKGENKND